MKIFSCKQIHRMKKIIRNLSIFFVWKNKFIRRHKNRTNTNLIDLFKPIRRLLIPFIERKISKFLSFLSLDFSFLSYIIYISIWKEKRTVTKTMSFSLSLFLFHILFDAWVQSTHFTYIYILNFARWKKKKKTSKDFSFLFSISIRY